MPSEYNPTNSVFSLERVRFEFKASRLTVFPPGKAGNIIRGALGWALKETNPDAYDVYFEPRRSAGGGPSGFANPPRPFVLRAGHLDGESFRAGEGFHVDLHLFRMTPPAAFITAMERITTAQLHACSQERIEVDLRAKARGIGKLRIRFITATELKAGGALSAEPEFPVLFSRARDRIRALSLHDLAVDFEGMAERSQTISMVSEKLAWKSYVRTSRKTGQTHPIGGFTGEAVYAGDLDEFVALMEAARWTGIGRQTVWGKGAIELEAVDSVASTL